jgi:hypothetical protein
MGPITLLGVTVNGRWQPGIGDPTLIGWLTSAAYLAAAWACWRSYVLEAAIHRSAPVGKVVPWPWFWAILSVSLAALGANKQLDLQTLLTQVARDQAHQQGWYPQRRIYQARFIMGIAIGALAALALLAWSCRHHWRKRLPAMAGITALLGFVVIRASSFQHVDRLLGMRLIDPKPSWILEIVGIICVAVAALLAARDARRHGIEELQMRQLQPSSTDSSHGRNLDVKWSP